MFKRKKLSREKGFTMIELLVVIALMGIIMSYALADYNGMNKKVELQNTVYSVALSIRESQVFGINKKLKNIKASDLSGNVFTDTNPYPYGLHIDTTKPNQIIMFRDVEGGASEGNKKFSNDCSSANPTECISIIKLNNGNKISKINLGDSFITKTGNFNVFFKRPDPDADIVDESSVGTSHSKIQIEVSSKSGKYKGCVEIGAAGDISLKNSCN